MTAHGFLLFTGVSCSLSGSRVVPTLLTYPCKHLLIYLLEISLYIKSRLTSRKHSGYLNIYTQTEKLEPPLQSVINSATYREVLLNNFYLSDHL